MTAHCTTCICDLEPVRHPWQHDTDCLRWAPPRTGPGHSDTARRAAVEAAREAVAAARIKRTTVAKDEHPAAREAASRRTDEEEQA